MKTLIVALALLVSGCACPAFVKGVDVGVQVIGPEYKGYVVNDPTLDTKSKEIRLRTLEELQKLIDEAKK